MFGSENFPKSVFSLSIYYCNTTTMTDHSAPKKTEGPIKCTWHLGTKEKSPHATKPS